MVIVGDGLGRLWSFTSRGGTNWKVDLNKAPVALEADMERSSVLARTSDGRVWDISARGRPLLSLATKVPIKEIVSGRDDVVFLVGADSSVLTADRRTGVTSHVLDLSEMPIHVGRRADREIVLITRNGRVTLVTQLAGQRTK
jgi:hypothetical protein